MLYFLYDILGIIHYDLLASLNSPLQRFHYFSYQFDLSFFGDCKIVNRRQITDENGYRDMDKKTLPSGHMTLIQRRLNVDATS